MTLISTDNNKPISRAKRLALEGRCPQCGEFSYPYYRCKVHRIDSNIRRVLRSFEKRGWVDVKIDPMDGKKMFKWNDATPKDIKTKKYSPEYLAKMSLPRINGKPLTDKLIEECIVKVLEANQIPLTSKEIEKGFKAMKTIGKIIPETDSLLNEYKLIKQKNSRLAKSQRDAVEYRINFLLKRGVISIDQIVCKD